MTTAEDTSIVTRTDVELIGNPLHSIEDSKGTNYINVNILGFNILIHLNVDVSQLGEKQ